VAHNPFHLFPQHFKSECRKDDLPVLSEVDGASDAARPFLYFTAVDGLQSVVDFQHNHSRPVAWKNVGARLTLINSIFLTEANLKSFPP